MRRSGSARLSATLIALAIAQGPADAAPFDFLFGRPPAARGGQAYGGGQRQRHRAPRASVPAPVAEIPLPVPRPHFPGDPPLAADTAEAPAETRPVEGNPAESKPVAPENVAPTAKGAERAAPRETGAEAERKPAEPAPGPPPPRPAEIAKPAAPDTKPPAPDTNAPAPAAPEIRQSPETKPAQMAPAQAPTSTTAPPSAVPPIPPPKPPEIAKPAETQTPPPAQPPAVAPSGATTAFTPRSPEDDPACPGRLRARNVAIEPVAIGPQPDDRCVIVEAVRLSSVSMPDGSKVAFPETPTIACTTADAFSLFVRDLMVPLSKGTFGAPIAAIWTGPGFECRSRDHVFGAKLSAHGQGLAIDIARLKLADGRMIEVGDPKTDLETGFETAARAGACGYFHTVLGPGSDAYHRTHWHFDLEVRGAHGDSKYCK